MKTSRRVDPKDLYNAALKNNFEFKVTHENRIAVDTLWKQGLVDVPGHVIMVDEILSVNYFPSRNGAMKYDNAVNEVGSDFYCEG